MPNLFNESPVVEEPVLSSEWTDPASGLVVPMEPAANLQFRSDLLAAAERDKDLQTDLYTACSKSVEYWVNVFCFTLRVFESQEDGAQRQASNAHVPFCLWTVQSRLILELHDAIRDGGEILTDKSRDMGASWIHVAVLLWFFLFRKDQSLLMISRKEDAVDQLDGQARNYPHGSIADPGTLFGKIDYILSRLPEWMLPPMTRKKMHLVNLSNRSRIDGESANANAGSSDRRTAIMLDEFAKVEEAESIKRSTKDVTACRLVPSTPNGAGTTFSKWRMSGTIKVFSLMWWHHPEKGKGLNARQDKMGRWRLHSPWYDRECEKRTPKEVAIEIDADHVGSGDQFFEPQILEQHKRLFARPPRRLGTIMWQRKLSDEDITAAVMKMDTKRVRLNPGGPMKIWVELVNGRLDQSKTYQISIDISKGQGASNSVMNVTCVETREKVAEWADANTPPYELARLACALAIWVGGRSKRPLVIYENNGDPGLDFGRQFVKTYRYPNVYFDRAQGTIGEKVGKRFGWRSSPDKKAEALGNLRRAYAHGRYINRSELAIAEASSYISYESGGIGPSDLVNEIDSARKAHGDRVIADMLAVWCLTVAGRISQKDLGAKPERSFGGRFERWKQAKKAKRVWRPEIRFDFTGAVA